MIYNLSKDLDKQRFKTRVNQLFKAGAKVELTERKGRRTSQQGRYLHLILSLYALETGYSKEQTKQDIFKRHVNREIFMQTKDGIEICRSSADLDTKEMTEAIERFRNHASEDAGIYLPGPNEAEILDLVEEQVERYGNRIYL